MVGDERRTPLDGTSSPAMWTGGRRPWFVSVRPQVFEKCQPVKFPCGSTRPRKSFVPPIRIRASPLQTEIDSSSCGTPSVSRLKTSARWKSGRPWRSERGFGEDARAEASRSRTAAGARSGCVVQKRKARTGERPKTPRRASELGRAADEGRAANAGRSAIAARRMNQRFHSLLLAGRCRGSGRFRRRLVAPIASTLSVTTPQPLSAPKTRKTLFGTSRRCQDLLPLSLRFHPFLPGRAAASRYLRSFPYNVRSRQGRKHDATYGDLPTAKLGKTAHSFGICAARDCARYSGDGDSRRGVLLATSPSWSGAVRPAMETARGNERTSKGSQFLVRENHRVKGR